MCLEIDYILQYALLMMNGGVESIADAEFLLAMLFLSSSEIIVTSVMCGVWRVTSVYI